MSGIKPYLTKRLRDKLSCVFDYPCTLLFAPKYSGKTTALKEFFLNEKDVSNGQFTAIWENAIGNTKEDFWEEFRSPFLGKDTELSHYLNGSTLPETPHELRLFERVFLAEYSNREEPTVFILDGIEETLYLTVKDFIHFFCQIAPDKFHLILSGQTDEALHDEFFRVYTLANYITLEDLQFTLHDMEEYYLQNNLSLSSTCLRNIYNSCSGWNILIHLNLKEYMANKRFLSKNETKQFVDYAIIKLLPSRSLEFLYMFTLKDVFALNEIEYVWEMGDAKELLANLCKQSLICYDIETETYRLVPVLCEYFKQSPNNIPEDWRISKLNRLAEWYLENDENENARRLYYRIKNFDALMNAVEKRRFIVLYGLDELEFLSYYTDCPPEIRAKYPKAILTFARQMFAFGNHKLGQEVCMEFERIMHSNQVEDEKTNSWLWGTYELLKCYANYNTLSSMLPHVYKAKDLLEDRTAMVPWPDTGLNDSFSILYMYHRKPGQLENETEAFFEYCPIYSSLIGGRLFGAEIVMKAEMLYLTGKILDAEITLYKALLNVHRDNQWHTWLCIVILKIRIALMQGNWHTIEHLSKEVEESLSLKKEFMLFPISEMINIFVYSKLGYPEKIKYKFDLETSSRFSLCFRAAPMLYCYCAEALLAKGEYMQLIAVSEHYLNATRVYPNIYAEIILSIIIAGAYEMIGDQGNAQKLLLSALALAIPDRIIMPFVELGRYISGTLQSLADNGNEFQECLEEITSLKLEYDQNIQHIKNENFIKPPMGLTARELEIVKLAAQRLSNKEIASALAITESTVKTQLSRAFAKLEISKRSELNQFTF